MKNRDVYQRDPSKISLLNNGVARIADVLTEDERKTLRFELEHFVCEGEYQRGLVRMLDAYVSNMGQPEQPAVWVSGFFGSGKSHLAKMLRYLWIDYTFPEDGATARGLARLPQDVEELLLEITTLGKRYGGLHAAAGTLGAGAGDSVRLAFLGIVFRSADLPESYPQARFCMWLRRNDIYDVVCASVEATGRDFRKELSDLYVSPVIAKALLEADPSFATNEAEAKKSLREQFPKPKDITTEEFVDAVQNALAPDGEMPCTVVILDEVQQYIGDDANRSYIVQEVVEACSKEFGDRLLFVGTGQTSLSGTPALQRLQGRFTVNIELSDQDVETVTRRVVLAKRPDRVDDIENVLDANAGEVGRHLTGSRIAPRSEDRNVIIDDYPLLPVRRRFWEHALRAVDKSGTAALLRTQLRIVYEAARSTVNDPLGTVVPADFLYGQVAPDLLRSGVLLREIHQTIEDQRTKPDGELRARLCSLIFLIRKLPRDVGVDIGVRATAEMLADLSVSDLSIDGTSLRAKLPAVLLALVTDGVLMKLDNEFSLQTRESSEWEAEFRNRESKFLNDPTRANTKRSQLLTSACQDLIGSMRLLHGKSKEPRRLSLHFSADAPEPSGQDIPVWIRDGWGSDEKSVVADARGFGSDSPILTVFIPKNQAEPLKKLIAQQNAAQETLDYKGTPTTREGIEARDAMHTRATEAKQNLIGLIREIIDDAKVIQGGGNEMFDLNFAAKVESAAEASLDRLFPDFHDADDKRWETVIRRAKQGSEHPLEAIDFKGSTDDHPVCSAILSCIGSGKKGKEVRSHFADPPYGWPRDAVDAGLISLFAGGYIRATHNGTPLKQGQLDQAKVSVTDFRVESATLEARQRLKLRKLFNEVGIDCKPNEEPQAATQFLQTLLDVAAESGGDPPLPERPKTQLVTDIQAKAGNEQLLAILEHHDDLKSKHDAWSKAKETAEKRLPEFRKLTRLLKFADGCDFTEDLTSQVQAILNNRRLLDSSDPVPGLLKTAVDGLRTCITEAERAYSTTFDAEMKTLEASDSWQKIKEEDRKSILQTIGLNKATKGSVGTADEVLQSLERISLHGWATRTAALPQQFAEARKQADKLLEPKIQHVKLGASSTLRTENDVKHWLSETEKTILARIKDGPVVVS